MNSIVFSAFLLTEINSRVWTKNIVRAKVQISASVRATKNLSGHTQREPTKIRYKENRHNHQLLKLHSERIWLKKEKTENLSVAQSRWKRKRLKQIGAWERKNSVYLLFSSYASSSFSLVSSVSVSSITLRFFLLLNFNHILLNFKLVYLLIFCFCFCFTGNCSK